MTARPTQGLCLYSPAQLLRWSAPIRSGGCVSPLSSLDAGVGFWSDRWDLLLVLVLELELLLLLLLCHRCRLRHAKAGWVRYRREGEEPRHEAEANWLWVPPPLSLPPALGAVCVFEATASVDPWTCVPILPASQKPEGVGP